MSYTVLIDDNYHYMDESHRVKQGEYETLEEARKACAGVVVNSMVDLYEPGMTPEALLQSYGMFGDDPFITGDDVDGVPFSGRAWAKAYAPVLIDFIREKTGEAS